MIRTRTVLYVDDDAMLLRSVARQLARHQMFVAMAETPAQAIAHLQSIDVALLDWDPSGPAMLEICETFSIPLVIYTGDIGSVPVDVRERHRVLTKPASGKELALQLDLAELDMTNA